MLVRLVYFFFITCLITCVPFSVYMPLHTRSSLAQKGGSCYSLEINNETPKDLLWLTSRWLTIALDNFGY